MSTATVRHRLSISTLVISLAFLPAYAQEWDETGNGGGDTGPIPATAQDLSTGNYTEITGEIESMTDVDMYKIFIDDPVSFSATTETSPGTLVDSWLYLFRSDGTCEYSNDESTNGSLYSTLPAGNAAGPTVNDVYYVAVAAWELIGFDVLAGKTCEDPRDFGPDWDRVNDGIPSAGGITSWGTPGIMRNTGTYRITLAGVLLPVELVGLEATATGSTVTLSWTTQSEDGNVGFHVERRSSDQEPFASVGFVAGSGTTSAPTSYAYIADDLPFGTHTFRLRQVDADGGVSYSSHVAATIALQSSYHISSVYPHPLVATGALDVTVRTEQHVVAELFDMLGRRVATLHNEALAANSVTSIEFDVGAVPAGLYVVRVAGDHFVDSRVVSIIH